jgi:hypothetical protein
MNCLYDYGSILCVHVTMDRLVQEVRGWRQRTFSITGVCICHILYAGCMAVYKNEASTTKYPNIIITFNFAYEHKIKSNLGDIDDMDDGKFIDMKVFRFSENVASVKQSM